MSLFKMSDFEISSDSDKYKNLPPLEPFDDDEGIVTPENSESLTEDCKSRSYVIAEQKGYYKWASKYLQRGTELPKKEKFRELICYIITAMSRTYDIQEPFDIGPFRFMRFRSIDKDFHMRRRINKLLSRADEINRDALEYHQYNLTSYRDRLFFINHYRIAFLENYLEDN